MQFYMAVKNPPSAYFKGAVFVYPNYVPDPRTTDPIPVSNLQLVSTYVESGYYGLLQWFFYDAAGNTLAGMGHSLTIRQGLTYTLDYKSGEIIESGGEEEGANWMPWAIGGGVLALIAGAVIVKNRKK